MNPTPNQPQSQDQNSGQLPHDDLRSALGFATTLQKGMLSQEAPQEPETAPEQPTEQETQDTPQEEETEPTNQDKAFGEINGKIDTLTQLVAELVKK